jgi:hypothetical protein
VLDHPYFKAADMLRADNTETHIQKSLMIKSKATKTRQSSVQIFVERRAWSRNDKAEFGRI